MINEIEMLSEDKVDVVRIALAISLNNIVKKEMEEKERMKEVLIKLKEDEEAGEYL